MKKTILIFGVSSFVGSNFLEMLKDEFRIIGTYHKTPVTIRGVTCIPCDVLKKEYVTSITTIIKPDITIYAAGMSSLKECQLSPKVAEALNSSGAANCAQASERNGAQFIYISSGYVLSGQDTIYREGETPIPNTTYGSTLSSTEFYIQRSCLNYLILRCSPLYGRGYNSRHDNWFETLQASFAKNLPIYADDSVYTGFLDVQILVKVVRAMIAKKATNRLFHVSSQDFMTRYEFAKTYARIFKKDEGLIQKTSGTFPSDRKSEGNTQYFYRLDTANIEEFLNVKMPKIEESLSITYKRLDSMGLT